MMVGRRINTNKKRFEVGVLKVQEKKKLAIVKNCFKLISVVRISEMTSL